MTRVVEFDWFQGASLEWIEGPTGPDGRSARWLVFRAPHVRLQDLAKKWERQFVEPHLMHEEPGDEPVIFERFGHLDPTEEAIIDFAAEYGLLGVMELLHGATAHFGEAFSTWKDEIEVMASTIRLWEAVKAGDDKRLNDPTRNRLGVMLETEATTEGGVMLRFREAERSGRSRPGWVLGRPVHIEQPLRSDLRSAGMGILQQRINRYLGEYCEAMLTSSPNRDLPELVIHPHNLLGFMWHEFAKAVEGNRAYRKCAGCWTWFDVDSRAAKSGRKVREDTKYCRDACKSRAYRQRAKAPSRS